MGALFEVSIQSKAENVFLKVVLSAVKGKDDVGFDWLWSVGSACGAKKSAVKIDIQLPVGHC